MRVVKISTQHLGAGNAILASMRASCAFHRSVPGQTAYNERPFVAAFPHVRTVFRRGSSSLINTRPRSQTVNNTPELVQ